MNKLYLAGLAVAALVSSCGDDITTQSDNPKEPTASTEVSSIAEANETLKSKDNVTITGEISGQSNIITIPAATASTSTTTKTIMMEKIAAGAKVEVKEGDNTNASTANDIVVSVPNPASSDKTAELDISTPNSTVTIKGNDGLTYLKKVNASTAEHTLIVTDGVTIGELEILKGNVRINKGAKVEKIDAKVPTIVYYEKGVTLPSEVYGDVTKCEIEVGAKIPEDGSVSMKVSSIAVANEILKSKDNVTITGEIGNSKDTIFIPAAAESTSKTTKTVRIEKIANGSADVHVKEAEGTTESTANDIVVSVPNLASSDNKVDLHITTPNSTVTIQGNDGLTTIKKVKIAAKNTIITDGVTITKELEIRPGNVGYVRINKGATVGKFEAEVPTTVYYEKGVNLPSEDYKNVTTIEIEVGATIQ